MGSTFLNVRHYADHLAVVPICRDRTFSIKAVDVALIIQSKMAYPNILSFPNPLPISFSISLPCSLLNHPFRVLYVTGPLVWFIWLMTMVMGPKRLRVWITVEGDNSGFCLYERHCNQSFTQWLRCLSSTTIVGLKLSTNPDTNGPLRISSLP